MAVFNATDAKLYKTGTPDQLITKTRTASFNMTAATIDVTTKDSNGWREILLGLRQASGSVEGLIDYAEGGSELNVDQLTAAFMAREKLSLKFKLASATVGSEIISFDCFLTSLPRTFNMEEAASFSVDFEVTGVPTFTTVTV